MMKTVVLPTHTARLFKEAVERATELLRAGEPVVLPTETVYGLAANALDAHAVGRVFDIKGRPAGNPVIVHVCSVAMARTCVSSWPQSADELAAVFWPGPLTLVLPRSSQIPDIVTAGGPTVGVRWPRHPLVQEVIRACGFPLAAPSANPAGQLSPTTPEHALKALAGKVPLIIDGGASQVGIESTVVDLAAVPLTVLRPGMISGESLLATVRGSEPGALMNDQRNAAAEGFLRSPGQLPKHYAPKAKLMILDWDNENDLKSRISSLNFAPARAHVIAHTRIPSGEGFRRVSVIPHDPEAFARALYSELHRCDEEGAELIVVEAVPSSPEWQGIMDRLQRAASDAA